MADVGNLTAKLTLDTAGFSSGVDQVNGVVGKLAGGVGSALTGVTAAVGAAVAGAAAGVASLVKQSVEGFGELQQLAGGAQKIFDQMDYSQIAADASEAWKTMGLSANDYLTMINQVGASFAATMGDQAGYEAAKQGMQAISDYASGTGRSVEELNQKFALITRSTSSYQSIADQFSGILPATSAAFLEQAQAAGFLSGSYEKLTQVPLAEYQQAVVQMLGEGVAALNLTGNTAEEAGTTLTGSLAAMKAAWENLVTSMSVGGQELEQSLSAFIESAGTFIENLIPIVAQALESVAQVIKEIAPVIAEELPGLVDTVAPMLLEAAVTIVNTVAEALPELISSIMKTLTELLPEISQTIISLIDTLIGTVLPLIIAFGGQLIESLANTITQNADYLSSTFMKVLTLMLDVIGKMLPSIISAGVSILSALAQAFSQNSAVIVAGIVNILTVILTTIIEHLPDIITAGLQIVSGLAMGIVQNLPQIASAVVQMIAMIPTVILQNLGDILQAAMQIGLAIAAGILLAIPSLLVAIGRFLGIVKEAETDYGKSTETIAQKSSDMQMSVEGSISGIESTLSGLSSAATSTSNSISSSMTSMSSTVKSVTVPVYDGMGNLVSSFKTTASAAQTSVQTITNTSSTAVSKSAEATTEIIKNSEKAWTSINKLDSTTASPEVDPSGVVDGCNEIVLAVEKAINALLNLSRMNVGAGGGFGGGHAAGGWMSAGTTYLVGELGPELITPTRSGYVHTAEETEDILGGQGGGITITIQGDVYDDERSMRKKLKNAVLGVLQEQVAYG